MEKFINKFFLSANNPQVNKHHEEKITKQKQEDHKIKATTVTGKTAIVDANIEIPTKSIKDMLVNANKNDDITPSLQESWDSFMKALDIEANIDENILDAFSNLEKKQFQKSFISYLIKNQGIKINNLTKILDISTGIIESLYYQSYSNKVDIIQKKMQELLCDLISAVNIDAEINKNELAAKDLTEINSYASYAQYKNLQNTESIHDQCIRDASRKFNCDITLSKNGKKLWQSNPIDNNLFKDCYNRHIQGKKHAMADWIYYCRDSVRDFVKLCSLDKLEQQTNAILLEATQAGSVVISRVLKEHLKKILNLPSHCDINLTDFNYKLDVDCSNDNIIMINQLIVNGIEIINEGVLVATLPPTIITSNLYYNYRLPENSYYDNFVIERI